MEYAKIKKRSLVEFLQSLVQIQSPAGDEQAVAARAASEMRALGFDRVYDDHNGSITGIIHGATSGPTLLFDAHCDTVGVAPGISWEYPPFSGTIAGGRMYGRGTSDMKGALAAMIYAVAAVDRAKLSGTAIVSVTVMEEVMEGLALKAVMDQVRPDFVVIGESTDLNLNVGGRGRAEIRLEATGKPAHTSAPHLGVNAVHKILPAIQAIERMQLPSDPLLGEAIMVLTDIISDPYPGHSVIPSRCRATYDRRLMPGETAETVFESLNGLPEIEGLNTSIVRGTYKAYTGAVLEGPKFFPAWKYAPEHPFIQASLRGLQSAGLDPSLGAYGYCTNAAYSAGLANIPTVGFGPSSEDLAHVVDEFIEIEHLHQAALGYLGIIQNVLGL